MNKLFGKIYGPLVVLVDIALLIDICSDLWKKHKERKAQKNNTEVIDEEDPQPETAPEV
jgi:hypothetical protein